MSIEISLPFGNKENVKNLVFTILTSEYPLKLISLTNFIHKRYGRAVTFQAVRKATLLLVSEGVLLREGNTFLINKEWVNNSKTILDELYLKLNKKESQKTTESIGGNVTVFTFNSLNNMMKFWQQLIDEWYKKFNSKDYQYNCYQAAHLWEGLLHSDEERIIMHQLKYKGIKSYILTTGNSPLGKQIVRFYKKIGIKTQIEPSSSSFDKSYYVGTYGDLVVQTQYPEEIVKELDLFFKKNKTLQDLDLVKLSEIVNKKQEIKLTVIKDINMAKQINKSIISQL
jgi:hypothetical protein